MSFELPKLEEKLFIAGDYSSMSYIGRDSPLDHIYLYAKGYKNAGDELVEKSINSKSNLVKDSYVYPIIFLYRHYLELRLKEIYLRFSQEEIDTKNLNHNLLVSWDKAKNIISKANYNLTKEKLDETLLATEQYIKQFAEKDLNSFVYRYPFAKSKTKGDDLKSYFEEELHIDMLHLKKRMQELENLLYGTIAILEHNEEIEKELLAEYDSFMDDLM